MRLHLQLWLRAKYKRLGFFIASLLISGILIQSVQANHAGDSVTGKDAINDIQIGAVSKQMVTIVQALLATVAESPGNIEQAVGYNRQQLLSLEFTDKARTNYVYWPYLRKGLPFDFMTAQQKRLVHDLMSSALSSKGYLSAIQVMQMEEVLASTETNGFPRGSENYTLAIFGQPANNTHWAWRFEGHHLSLNFNVSPGEISVTPSFFGASPAEIRSGNLAGFRNQHKAHEYGLALVNALDETQRAIAIQAEKPPSDIISGTLNKAASSWEDWKTLKPGLELKHLSSEQQALAQAIIDEVVTTYRPEISKSYLSNIDINDLTFSWYGGTEGSDPHYYRIDGADFFFEYDLVQNDGNHVHAVWRSKNGDFGADLLMQHHQQDH